MEKEESLGEQMQQSEESFRKQFDPTSPEYHKGLETVVPVGGVRVPESMPTLHPEGYDPTKVQEVIDYGEEYKQIENSRNVYQNLKKDLAKLGPIVQAFLRHEDHFKTKGDVTNEKHVKTYQQNVEKETASLKAVQNQLQAYEAQLDSIDAEGKQTAKELLDIIHQSSKKYDNKQSLTDFNFKLKKLSAKTFAIAQKCLQKLKDIKKEYTTKQKLAQAEKKEQ